MLLLLVYEWSIHYLLSSYKLLDTPCIIFDTMLTEN